MSGIDDRWEQHKDEIAKAARNAGIDPGIMAKIAGFESGYDPSARPVSSSPRMNGVTQFDGVMAISSAYGYGQFLNGTWQDMINRYGEKYGIPDAAQMTKDQANAPELRNDTKLQAAMLAEFTRENIEKGAKLGGSNADANVYAFHNLGDSDASKLLNAYKANPEQRVDAVLSDHVILGNPALYGDGSRTISQAYDAMGQAMGRYEKYAVEAVSLSPRAKDPLTEIDRLGMRLQLGAVPGASVDGLPDYLRKPSAQQRDEFADGVLKPGEHGPAVRGLQERLAGSDIKDGHGQPVAADSSYGRSTREAVENAQLWSGLPVTGVADRDTVAAVVDPTRRAGAPARSEDAADLNQHDELRPRTAAQPQPADPGPPAMANPVQSHGPRDSRDPRDPTHPDHALYEQIRAGVEKLDVQHGRGFDATSERMSLSLLTLAKETGITKVDEVVLSRQTSTLPAGATVFLVQGDRSNEAMHREGMPTAVATQTPPEKSMQQLEVVNQQLVQQQAQAQQEALARGPGDPSRTGPSMGGR